MTSSVVVFDAISVALCVASDYFLACDVRLTSADGERPSTYSLGMSHRICTLHGAGVRVAWGVDETTSIAELAIMARLPLVPHLAKTSSVPDVLERLTELYGNVVYATSQEVKGLPSRVTAVRVPEALLIGQNQLDTIFRLLTPGGRRG